MAKVRKRRVSAATIARLRELRRAHGLGEFSNSGAGNRKRRGKKVTRTVRKIKRRVGGAIARIRGALGGSGLGL